MIHELETKIIDAYLNKEITLLEKEMGLFSVLKYFNTYLPTEKLDIDKLFNHIIKTGKFHYSGIEKKYTQKEVDVIVEEVYQMRERLSMKE